MNVGVSAHVYVTCEFENITTLSMVDRVERHFRERGGKYSTDILVL
jgi:hypothetical protein